MSTAVRVPKQLVRQSSRSSVLHKHPRVVTTPVMAEQKAAALARELEEEYCEAREEIPSLERKERVTSSVIDGVEKLVILLTKSRGKLTTDERRCLAHHFVLYDFDCKIDSSKRLQDIPGTAIIVRMSQKQAVGWYNRQLNRLREDPTSRVILLCKRGEKLKASKIDPYEVDYFSKELPALDLFQSREDWLLEAFVNHLPQIRSVGEKLVRKAVAGCLK